jgi:hypothetical protein
MEIVLNAMKNLHSWRVRNGWRGFDPFGIREKLYERFGMGEKAVALQTLIADLEKQYHFDRPDLFHQLLDDRGYLDPKTFANFGTGYLKMFKATGEIAHLETAGECGRWLIEDSKKRDIPAWGHPFVWYTEANDYFHKKDNPNIYITSLVAHFLLDLFEATGEECYSTKAREAVCYLASLPRLTRRNGVCFWYIVDREELPIHNGNLFVASVLIRSGNQEYISLGQRAVEYTLSDQNEDGSWYYYGLPRSPKMMWIDNYHSGFILEALHRCNEILHTGEIDLSIRKGLGFYRRLFGPQGEPQRPGNPFPQDIHDASQGIITFCLLGEREAAERIAGWAIREMQDQEGFFYYRKLGTEKIIRFPYMRWSQAPMFKALAMLLAESNDHMKPDRCRPCSISS